MILTSDRLTLRTPQAEDAPSLLAFYERNRAHFEPWDPQRSETFYTLQYHKDRLEKSGPPKDKFYFFVFKKDDFRKIIGSVELTNISRGIFQNCNIGYKLDFNEMGNGYMQEAVETVIAYAFKELAIHRIEANIMPANVRSIQLIMRLGFQNEGMGRKLLKIRGAWEDHWRFALLAPEGGG